MKIKNKNIFSIILFVIYLLILCWAILLKFNLSVAELRGERVINIIPFGGTAGGNLGLYEILLNVFLFIPLGAYIGIFGNKITFFKKSLYVFGASLFFEIIQFIFAIGRSDITDIICNTLGGMLGICIYILLNKMLQQKAVKALNIAFIIAVILVVILFIFVTKVVGLRIKL